MLTEGCGKTQKYASKYVVLVSVNERKNAQLPRIPGYIHLYRRVYKGTAIFEKSIFLEGDGINIMGYAHQLE